jgi:hypothetical protein
MYWKLAHTTMSRWQKITILALTVQNKNGPFKGWNEGKQAFLWSEVEHALRVKKEFESHDYRDATTVKAFLETYCDTTGKRVFEVESTENNTLQDFWIRPIGGLVKKNVTISLNSDQGADLVGNISSGLVRPTGISNFQWRKMKEAQGGLNDEDKEIDLL